MSEPLSRGQLFIEFEKDLEALQILVRCWKGRSRDAFYAIIDLAQTLEARYASQYFFRIRNTLAKHPDVCPNCFGKHDLPKCTELKENPWENLASYTHPDFTQLTKKNQARRQKAFLRWVERSDTT
ncbi:hypothetical protein OXX79_012481 [Metschnikowia pulcherrima]